MDSNDTKVKVTWIPRKIIDYINYRLSKNVFNTTEQYL